MITRQDILDRLDALLTEHGVAYRAERARIAKERQSLQELCGGLGHLFRKPTDLSAYGDKRSCVFCSVGEGANPGPWRQTQ